MVRLVGKRQPVAGELRMVGHRGEYVVDSAPPFERLEYRFLFGGQIGLRDGRNSRLSKTRRRTPGRGGFIRLILGAGHGVFLRGDILRGNIWSLQIRGSGSLATDGTMKAIRG